jgi:hypothetical protein
MLRQCSHYAATTRPAEARSADAISAGKRTRSCLPLTRFNEALEPRVIYIKLEE